MLSQSQKAIQLSRLELKDADCNPMVPVTHGVTCGTHMHPSPPFFFMWMIVVKYVKADSLRQWNKTFSRLNRYRKYIVLGASNETMT